MVLTERVPRSARTARVVSQISNFPARHACGFITDMLSAFSASLAFTGGEAADLARPAVEAAERLSDAPNIWLARDFLSEATVAHMRSKVPTDEGAYQPCIGQVEEFDSKRCAFLPVQGDALLEAAVARIGQAWNVDTSRLQRGLPLIRYLPGAPPVGKHGDEDRHGVVPNATLVVYLTGATGGGGSAAGQTVFPEAGVAVSPTPGRTLTLTLTLTVALALALAITITLAPTPTPTPNPSPSQARCSRSRTWTPRGRRTRMASTW